MGQLAIYERMPDPLVAAEQMGNWIAKGGIVPCKNEEAGRTVAMICLAQGIDIMEFARTYHMIGNRPSMKAEAKLAKFRTDYGGDHEVVERSPERAAIRLKPKGKDWVDFEYTWEEAQKSRWPWKDPNDHSKGLKDNWSTDTDRRNMLWQRLIGDSVDCVCPEIDNGAITQWEADFQAEPTNGQPVDAEQLMREAAEQVEDAEVVDVQEEPEQPEPELVTGAVVAQIKELLAELNPSDEQIAKIQERRGVSAWHQLTMQQAAELLKALDAKVQQRKAQQTEPAEDPTEGESRLPDDAQQMHETSPVTQPTIDEIKGLLAGEPQLIADIKAHLAKHGKAKIADLSQRDAELLANCLQIKALDGFFERSLSAVERPEGNE